MENKGDWILGQNWGVGRPWRREHSLFNPSKSIKITWNRALEGFERFDHALGHATGGPDAVLAGNDVPAFGIQKPDDLEVPGRFAIAFQ